MSDRKSHQPTPNLVARGTRVFSLTDSPQAGPASEFQPVNYHPGQWLALAEAAAYTGLPQSTLRKLLNSGKLRGLDTGPRLGGRWRFKRSDLDNI